MLLKWNFLNFILYLAYLLQTNIFRKQVNKNLEYFPIQFDLFIYYSRHNIQLCFTGKAYFFAEFIQY